MRGKTEGIYEDATLKKKLVVEKRGGIAGLHGKTIDDKLPSKEKKQWKRGFHLGLRRCVPEHGCECCPSCDCFPDWCLECWPEWCFTCDCCPTCPKCCVLPECPKCPKCPECPNCCALPSCCCSPDSVVTFCNETIWSRCLGFFSFFEYICYCKCIVDAVRSETHPLHSCLLCLCGCCFAKEQIPEEPKVKMRDTIGAAAAEPSGSEIGERHRTESKMSDDGVGMSAAVASTMNLVAKEPVEQETASREGGGTKSDTKKHASLASLSSSSSSSSSSSGDRIGISGI